MWGLEVLEAQQIVIKVKDFQCRLFLSVPFFPGERLEIVEQGKTGDVIFQLKDREVGKEVGLASMDKKASRPSR